MDCNLLPNSACLDCIIIRSTPQSKILTKDLKMLLLVRWQRTYKGKIRKYSGKYYKRFTFCHHLGCYKEILSVFTLERLGREDFLFVNHSGSGIFPKCNSCSGDSPVLLEQSSVSDSVIFKN